MPYDPRPITKGGNRSIDIEFSRKPPKGKFRIIGVDTFDGTDWHDKDVDTLQEARDYCTEKVNGRQMLKYHVYDDRGNNIYSMGTF